MSIVHITSRQEWVKAAAAGAYVAPSLASEGFIHCSTAAQVVPVAREFYGSQEGLVLLVIDPGLLTSALRWEPPSDGSVPAGVPAGASFPHIYGPINLNAVVQVLDFEPELNGQFRLPPSLQTDIDRNRS